MSMTAVTRRSFLALSATLPLGVRFPWMLPAARAHSSIPVGLEMYSVRDELQRDTEGTVRAVAKMGYQGLEFYAPYFEWTQSRTKQMRGLLDDLGIRCFSTHNDGKYFGPENLSKARDWNLILGSKYLVEAYSDPKKGSDGWRALADSLNAAAERLEPVGLKVGYHNHDAEWKPVEGQRPMEILARNTKPTVMLQLDVGTCLEAGADPVEWIRANPGRIRSMHCKDWSKDPAVAYQALFAEGVADWKNIFAAAESVGGIEYYLIEQEGSRFPEMETASRCLQTFRTMREAR
jgi:sugar phosphate isomerase/epimerase